MNTESWNGWGMTTPASRTTDSDRLRCGSASSLDEDLLTMGIHDPDRYVERGHLGFGGMAEVRRVHDRRLQRDVAMKLLRTSLLPNPEWRVRFRAEACLVARLQHPSIVPIFDFGVDREGRFFFTMPEIEGETFARLIHRAHADRGEAPTLGLGPLRRLIGVLATVCQAVAYAHDQHVLHRDLKPDNIMVGTFAQVFVLDWGIASLDLLREPVAVDLPPDEPAPQALPRTLAGTVKGTPGYMSPEQARGDWPRVDARADVWSLGAILYEILAGRCPNRLSQGGRERREPTARPSDAALRRPPHSELLPPALVALCDQALEPDPERRVATARALGTALQDWLDGVQNVERGRALVAEADTLHAEIEARRLALAARRAEALRELGRLGERATEGEKAPAWEQLEEIDGAEAELSLREAERDTNLQRALTLAPDLTEAQDRIADLHVRAHAEAELTGDRAGMLRHEHIIRTYHRGRHASYLRGEASFQIRFSRPLRVRLSRYTLVRRRLVERPVADLGWTREIDLRLEVGSYVAHLEGEEGVPFQYPFELRRTLGEVAAEPLPPLEVPDLRRAPPGAVFVPAGWTWIGGDPLAFGTSLPLQRALVEAFWIHRHPVTNEEFLAFINDLQAAGREQEALRFVPRERSARAGVEGAMIYRRAVDGQFALGVDCDGDRWRPRWPATMTELVAIEAYARWWSERIGMLGRLPYEVEWERAARGADRRAFPWGSEYDATWCAHCDSSGNNLSEVDSFSVDQSPFGVRGLAGNVMDALKEPFCAAGPTIHADGRWEPAEGPEGRRLVKGGNFGANIGKSRISYRGSRADTARTPLCGFRLVFPVSAVQGAAGGATGGSPGGQICWKSPE